MGVRLYTSFGCPQKKMPSNANTTVYTLIKLLHSFLTTYFVAINVSLRLVALRGICHLGKQRHIYESSEAFCVTGISGNMFFC